MPKKARRPERPAEAGAPFGPPSTLPAMRTARGVEPKAGAPSGGIHQTAGDIDRGVEPKAGAPSGNRSARKNRAKRESAATRVPTVYQYSSIALSGLAWRVHLPKIQRPTETVLVVMGLAIRPAKNPLEGRSRHPKTGRKLLSHKPTILPPLRPHFYGVFWHAPCNPPADFEVAPVPSGS